MSNKPKLDNPQYTTILYYIFKHNPSLTKFPFIAKDNYDNIRKKLKYLEKCNIIRYQGLPGNNRKKPIIMYSGITSFIFLTFFKKELIEIKKDLSDSLPYFKGFNYNSPDMLKLIKAHLKKEFEDIKNPNNINYGIRELFHRLILNQGNKIIEGSVSYPEYKQLRKRIPKKDLAILFDDMLKLNPSLIAHSISYDLEKALKKLSDKQKRKAMNEVINKTGRIIHIDAHTLFLSCVSLYVSEINNKNFFNIMKNTIDDNVYLKNKEEIDDIFKQLEEGTLNLKWKKKE